MKKILLISILHLASLLAVAQEREWFSEEDITGLNFPGDARNNAVSFVIGDTAYVGTGDKGSTTIDFWKYVPETSTWSQIANFPGDRRSGAIAFTFQDKGYVGLGKGAGNYYNDFYRYDPIANEWSNITDFAGDGRSHAVAFILNDTVYVGSGKTQSADYTSDFWKYDPTVSAWSQIESLPGYARAEAFSFATDSLGYVGGGYRPGPNTAYDLYSYDPRTGSWTERGSNYDPFRRENGVAFVLEGKAFIGLGFTQKDFVVYDIAANTTDNTSGPEDNFGSSDETSRWGAIAFVVQGKAFVGLGGAVGGNTINNDLWSFQYPAPVAPEVLAISASTLTEATLTWNDLSDDEQGFAIERSVDNNTSFTALATVAANVATYTDNTLQSGKVYYYRVRATGALESSTYSNQATVDTYITLNAPEALAVSAVTLTAATLTWSDRSDNEQGFEIERSVGDNTTFTSLTTVTANTTTYQDATLSSDQVYYYRVRATGATENSLYSNEVTINTYTAPENLTATAQGANEIALSWQDNSSLETGFVIERSTDGVTFTELTTLPSDAVAYTDMSATAGTDYQYRVYALVGDINTDATNTATAGTLISPVDLSVVSATGSTVQITWSYTGSNASHYVIERKTGDTGSFVPLESVVISNSNEYSDATVEEVQQYTYRIKTTDATRSSGFSPEIQATTGLNAPTAVTATVQDSTVLLSWNDASQRETHYIIYRSLADGSALVAVNTVVANTTSFEDTTIPDNGDYRYSVRAIGATTSSNSVESNVVTVSAKAETTEGEDEGGEEGGEEETTEEDGGEETTAEEGEEETSEEGGGEETTTEEEGEPNEEEEVITGTNDPLSEEVVKVYPNPSSGQIFVDVGSERFAYVAVFNSQGRLVNEVQQAEQSATATVRLDLQHFPAGMYTLRIYTARGVFVKKIAKQ